MKFSLSSKTLRLTGVIISQICIGGLVTAFVPITKTNIGLAATRQIPVLHPSQLNESNDPNKERLQEVKCFLSKASKGCTSLALMTSMFVTGLNTMHPPQFIALAAADGASSASNAKITTGGASTLQSGRTIAITRGVNLDNSNFGGQNLRGVAFQQSIVRDANFVGSNLVGASFFDATVDGSNFEGADMSLANVEMAQFNRANLKNAVMREMYVSGSTLFQGVSSIEGSDWTDTYLRKDQTLYLCNHPTAKGTNPKTGVDTRESLMCKD